MHLSHAERCQRPVPPQRLMCARHWRMVPEDKKALVLSTFQQGQCERKIRPSREWVKAARAAIFAVQNAEDALRRQIQRRQRFPKVRKV